MCDIYIYQNSIVVDIVNIEYKTLPWDNIVLTYSSHLIFVFVMSKPIYYNIRPVQAQLLFKLHLQTKTLPPF